MVQGRQPHQLTHEEEQAILNTCHRPEYQSLPPSQIVPLLADNGVYLASESSFYRVLKKHHQQHPRGRMKPRRPVPAPTSFTATGPNQVWSWDISFCASVVRGQHWYLYLIMDIYSRKIIAWEVHDTESGELAKQLLERALLREGCWHQPPVLHSDNGAPMTSYTLKARLTELGMLMSYSRPRVSNDNPYSEALFRTVKYCPSNLGTCPVLRSVQRIAALPHSISQHIDSQLRRPVPPADSRIPDFHQISDRQVRRDGDEDVGGSQYRKIEPPCGGDLRGSTKCDVHGSRTRNANHLCTG